MNSENLTFLLTHDEINFIGQALGKLPYENVAALIMKLQIQAAQQAAQAQVATEAPAEEAPAEDEPHL